ncbi:MAG: hypothetical protein ACM3VV_02135 [Deltaproteobacteria bacterium]
MTTTREEEENNIVKFETGEYKQLRGEFRYHWEEGRIAAEKAGKDLNEMVSLIHKEFPEWSISKIAKKIWIDNEDLDGFSQRTVYNNLNENNKALLDPSFQNNAKKNNVIEESIATLQPNVIEDSSIHVGTGPSPSFGKVIGEDLPEPTEEIKKHFDEESSYEVRELKNNLENSNKTIQELGERIQQLLSIQKRGGGTIEYKFDFEYHLEVRDQILPLIVTCFPEKNWVC